MIGLREGLEAALIVGIIAAFLRKNGKRLTAMWIGVVLAVILSIIVGVGLDVAEQSLPQARQEGMETIIGAVAVFFVTGMIAWMNAHAQDMRRQLEAEAANALSQASAYALASMAFLAVLKEGFETSVFLLATFSVAQSAQMAVAGAVIGLLMAVVIGWGIYIGGVKINLSRFFSFTGAFLILVAAGLVISSLRTAHEAGWLNVGQQAAMNLSWLVAPGTIQSALITGVLGIPADPRQIEVAGWLIYLIVVALFVYWPLSLRPGPRLAARLQIAAAAAFAAVALAMVMFYPVPRPAVPERAPIVAAADAAPQPIGTLRLTAASEDSPATLQVALNDGQGKTLLLSEDQRRQEQYEGIDASVWTLSGASPVADSPSTVTLDDVVTLNGGRIPIGLNPQQHPGPFNASLSMNCSTRVWVADGVLLDAGSSVNNLLTLSGSGLQTPRTLMVNDAGAPPAACHWQVDEAYRDKAVAAMNLLVFAREERQFWAVVLPTALAIASILLMISAARILIRLCRAAKAVTADSKPHHSLNADNLD
ncbi:iron uptake transporter permease EfeU [Sodalis sp. dw_96]|uniref:iron uptake transporter permease EfeU n=1 Tax=Sodalis sp. dw_96 TaxID=2719794 RepID=UPI001BD43286